MYAPFLSYSYRNVRIPSSLFPIAIEFTRTLSRIEPEFSLLPTLSLLFAIAHKMDIARWRRRIWLLVKIYQHESCGAHYVPPSSTPILNIPKTHSRPIINKRFAQRAPQLSGKRIDHGALRRCISTPAPRSDWRQRERNVSVDSMPGWQARTPTAIMAIMESCSSAATVLIAIIQPRIRRSAPAT